MFFMRARYAILVLLPTALFWVACGLPAQFPRVPEKLDTNYSQPICMTDPCIAVVSHSTLDVNYAQMAIENHRAYAKKHGYAYVFRNNLISDAYINPYASDKIAQLGLFWQKPVAIRDALAKKDADGNELYKWVFWIDIDALFTERDTRIESLIAQYAGNIHNPAIRFLISNDVLSPVQAGVFLVHNSPWARELFDNILALYPYYRNHPLNDQGALSDYLYGYALPNGRGSFSFSPELIKDRSYLPHDIIRYARVLPQGVLSPFYRSGFLWPSDAVWKPGNFVVHMAGPSHGFSTKFDAIKHLTDCLKAHEGSSLQCD